MNPRFAALRGLDMHGAVKIPFCSRRRWHGSIGATALIVNVIIEILCALYVQLLSGPDLIHRSHGKVGLILAIRELTWLDRYLLRPPAN